MTRLAQLAAIAAAVAGLAAPAAAQTMPGSFVHLRSIDPSIIQDIRYATTNNFAGHVLKGYEAAEFIVTCAVGHAL